MAAVLRRVLLAVVISLGGSLPAGAQDDYEALPDGEGKDMVYGLCSGCHSLKLVMQQGMSRKKWHETLEWMVEKQGMAELDPETEDVVLDYLAKHYGVDSTQDDARGTGAPSPFGSVRPLMPPQ